MTRPGIEPRSPGPLANTLTAGPIKLATVEEVDPKAPFSMATTPRCWDGRYSFPWIVQLYRWNVPYNVKQRGIKHPFWVFDMNPGLSDYWRTFHPFNQWVGYSCLNYAKNNLDISFYQIHSPKLLEDIFKYYWLNLFKEIVFGFNHGFETSSESPVRLLYIDPRPSCQSRDAPV